jgi:hypothetical protein
MDDSYTHITLVADRSGSMAAVQSDAQGAINTFIDEQKKVAGHATLTLIDFDAPVGGGDDWYHVHHDGDIHSAQSYSLRPRGNTALLDAVGTAITQTGERLAALDEKLRPGKVVFVIQTDGQENSSRDWTWEKLQETIKRQTEEYNWQFVFLGMGSDSWDQGVRMGVSNVIRSSGSGIAHSHTHSVMNAYVADYRTGNTSNLAHTHDTTVDAKGRVFNAAGEEIDPVTGKVKRDVQS